MSFESFESPAVFLTYISKGDGISAYNSSSPFSLTSHPENSPFSNTANILSKKTINDATIDMPLVPYQKLLWKTLNEHKHIWIKKARGLGLSTFMLYYIAYKCLTEWTAGDHVVIVTGTRIETAADLIRRLKLLFKRNFPNIYSQLMKQKDTMCVLNGVTIEAYPAGHTDSIRGRDRVKLIMVDEADYFSPSESNEILSVIEGFIGKPNSDPTICLISTPNRPDGLFNKIEQDQHSLYYKLFLSYQYGLEGDYPIYSKEQIEEARKSPDFPREYIHRLELPSQLKIT